MESSEKSGRGKNPSAEGIFPPPFRETRTTKKARFRDEEVADDTPVHVSYKETLVNSSRAMETGYDGGAVDWEFEEGDVTEIKDGTMPSITLSDRVHEKLCEPWKNSVIVKLLGRTIGYRTLCTRLNAMWKTTMTYSVIDLENNYFLVRFRSATDAVDALTKGPWIIMGHYLTVQPWTLSFDANTTDMEQVNVWIRLPGLDVHLYNRKVLQKLGELVGTVIRIDSNTASSARGRFARIAVHISLAKPLVSQFVLDGKVQKVEYEGLPVICFTCERYGHSSSSCKSSNSANNSGEWVQPQPNTQPQGNTVQLDDHGNIDSNAEKGRKFNSGKDINNGLNRNRENTGAGVSRFQNLEQVTDDREHPHHAAVIDNPSTSHQPNTANPYQIFTANHEDRTKTLARCKQHTTTVTAKPQKKTPASSLNLTRNPFQQSTFTLREENTNFLPHANPRTESCLNPQFNPSHQQISPLVTTLDPKMHMVIFCANQNFSLGDVREAGSDQGDRLGREYEHSSDFPDGQHAGCVNDVNAQAHSAMSMGENEREEMSDEEDSMIEETPLALMHDRNGQH
ncbi:DUF4283 domain-containing protein [Citrus sinensis]|uniref:DUF4283 domain-containing protein n=1 Tax=Citrus sinensis TaxID=2711 RepID=A0ACB8MDB6_CITSI|nr:DUF4283 domain-containing protein [Citrus sinensis]